MSEREKSKGRKEDPDTSTGVDEILELLIQELNSSLALRSKLRALLKRKSSQWKELLRDLLKSKKEKPQSPASKDRQKNDQPDTTEETDTEELEIDDLLEEIQELYTKVSELETEREEMLANSPGSNDTKDLEEIISQLKDEIEYLKRTSTDHEDLNELLELNEQLRERNEQLEEEIRNSGINSQDPGELGRLIAENEELKNFCAQIEDSLKAKEQKIQDLEKELNSKRDPEADIIRIRERVLGILQSALDTANKELAQIRAVREGGEPAVWLTIRDIRELFQATEKAFKKIDADQIGFLKITDQLVEIRQEITAALEDSQIPSLELYQKVSTLKGIIITLLSIQNQSGSEEETENGNKEQTQEDQERTEALRSLPKEWILAVDGTLYLIDFYDLLGIGKDAEKNEIKKAYRKQAKKYHPDGNQDDNLAERRFNCVKLAYDVLLKNRTKYNESYEKHKDYLANQELVINNIHLWN